MGVPTGGYPKMVTGTDGLGRLVPLVWPAGHAKQFTYVILNNATDETAYTGQGALPAGTVVSGSGMPNTWENRHHS